MFRCSRHATLLVVLLTSQATATLVRNVHGAPGVSELLSTYVPEGAAAMMPPVGAIDAHAEPKSSASRGDVPSPSMPKEFTDGLEILETSAEKLDELLKNPPSDATAPTPSKDVTRQVKVEALKLAHQSQKLAWSIEAHNVTDKAIKWMQQIQLTSQDLAVNTSVMVDLYMGALDESQKRRDEIRSTYEQAQHQQVELDIAFWKADLEFATAAAAAPYHADDPAYEQEVQELLKKRTSASGAVHEHKRSLKSLQEQLVKAEDAYVLMLHSVPGLKETPLLPSVVARATKEALPDVIKAKQVLQASIRKHADGFEDAKNMIASLGDQRGNAKSPGAALFAVSPPQSGAQRSAGALQSLFVGLFALSVGAFGLSA